MNVVEGSQDPGCKRFPEANEPGELSASSCLRCTRRPCCSPPRARSAFKVLPGLMKAVIRSIESLDFFLLSSFCPPCHALIPFSSFLFPRPPNFIPYLRSYLAYHSLSSPLALSLPLCLSLPLSLPPPPSLSFSPSLSALSLLYAGCAGLGGVWGAGYSPYLSGQ